MTINKNEGFTLSEALVAMAVVGVVATLTIPAVMENINATKYKNQYKTTMAKLNDMVKMAVTTHDVDFSDIKDTNACTSTVTLDSKINICSFFNSVFDGGGIYASGDLTDSKGRSYSIASLHSKSPSFVYQMINGSFVAFNDHMPACTTAGGVSITALDSKCYGYIDTNGAAPPNREVVCSNGSAAVATSAGTCVVRNNSDMGDQFPIVFHDDVVEPYTNAGFYVLKQSK